MITKILTRSVLVVVGILVVGGLLFGTDVVSYFSSSARSVRTAVKDSVPIEFELRRARDLLEEIIPEMHANIRLIAQEEVEIAALKADITKSLTALDEEKVKIAKLRNSLEIQQASYSFGDKEYSRNYVKDDLSNRFERFKESEVVLAGKQKLLTTREKSLESAMTMLEKTRSRKALLEDKIESLTSQYRLVKAASVGSNIQVDNSKLTQTEKLITQIQKRLDVAERVLAHESQFVQEIPVDAVPEEDLLTQVDEYFQGESRTANNGAIANAAPAAELFVEN
ncbi:MAG: hypothetical protein JW787_01610 [Sedimentisphaerales bacterium]|nr:hypothetical protein [Sedimentisphaerales bacterium]